MGIEEGQFPVELQEQLYEANNGYCAQDGCVAKISEFHHIIPNTVVNRRNYPLFISSPFNSFPTCREHHVSGHRMKIRYEVAAIMRSICKN